MPEVTTAMQEFLREEIAADNELKITVTPAHYTEAVCNRLYILNIASIFRCCLCRHKRFGPILPRYRLLVLLLSRCWPGTNSKSLPL